MSSYFKHFISCALDDAGPWIVRFVHPVSEAHQALFLLLHALHECWDVVDVLDSIEHAQHSLVGASVQRAIQCGHGYQRAQSRDPHFDEPMARIVVAEQFCSWSACKMKSTSSARSSTGLGLYSRVPTRNSMLRKFAV